MFLFILLGRLAVSGCGCQDVPNKVQWGFLSHQLINYKAVFALPPPLFYYYKSEAAFIANQATAADKRRSILPDEAAKHFLDLEFYTPYLVKDSYHYTWDSIPKKVSKDSMNSHGILPWNYIKLMHGLIEAFKNQDHYRILKISADIGHYVADACVPLHTTENYNGQKTGQIGLHGLWETRIPHIYFDSFSFIPSNAMYWPSFKDSIFKIILESHFLVDTILKADQYLISKYHGQRPTELIWKNGTWKLEITQNYGKEFNQLLGNMVYQRLSRAVYAVSSSWYTAWILAGMPILDSPLTKYKKEENSMPLEQDHCEGH